VATQALLEVTPAPALTIQAPPGAGRRRVELDGVRVDRVDLAEAAAHIDHFLRSAERHQVVTVNLDFLAVARQNPRFRETLNRASLAVADGMPLVWLSRLRGEPLPERVTGMALVDECAGLAERDGRGVYLLGAAPGIAEAAGRALQKRYPGLRIAGTCSPPVGALSARDNASIVREINRCRPAVLLVALGAPRQDLWIRDNLHALDLSVAMGVGCVFDVLAGVVDRAPTWMQSWGLEWAYRLGREPRRLWRRYVLNDAPLFARLLLSEARA
jgi:N-acetylglucosaminyldiphosphoundecaprenol N-acetyl-beta-D-mannosaminyltransferase